MRTKHHGTWVCCICHSEGPRAKHPRLQCWSKDVGRVNQRRSKLEQTRSHGWRVLKQARERQPEASKRWSRLLHGQSQGGGRLDGSSRIGGEMRSGAHERRRRTPQELWAIWKNELIGKKSKRLCKTSRKTCVIWCAAGRCGRVNNSSS